MTEEEFEAAAALEDSVKLTWDIEELVRLNAAAEAIREEGIYNIDAMNQLSRGF